jgi:hypothetical protein
MGEEVVDGQDAHDLTLAHLHGDVGIAGDAVDQVLLGAGNRLRMLLEKKNRGSRDRYPRGWRTP